MNILWCLTRLPVMNTISHINTCLIAVFICINTYTQAGLVFCQGYISEKCCANQIQNFHLKHCISWGLGDWQPHPKHCMIIPLGDIWTCRVHMYCIYSTYTGYGKSNGNTWQYRNKTAYVGSTERTSVADNFHYFLFVYTK